MKKTMVLVALMVSAAAMHGQESRQDVSVSGFGLFAPQVNGNGAQQTATKTLGVLASYRYMLTPHSALEVNYSFAQNTNRYQTSSLSGGVHTMQQEFTAAYVYSLTFKNYSPFVEAGVGTLVFSPEKDNGTTFLDTKRNARIGGLFGGGLAYEISPSFDIRAEYRGFVAKAPDFGLNDQKTNRYELVSMPSIGVAYHF